MNRALIVTIIGPDQTGIVRRIADCVTDNGGSWEQSHMSHLSGQFAGILRIVCPVESVERLILALRNQEKENDGQQIHIIQDAIADEPNGTLLELDLIANDRPGIVSELSAAIAAAGCNIEELETGIRSSPWSGDLLFHATGRINLTDGTTRASLQEQLEGLGLDFQVTLSEGLR